MPSAHTMKAQMCQLVHWTRKKKRKKTTKEDVETLGEGEGRWGDEEEANKK